LPGFADIGGQPAYYSFLAPRLLNASNPAPDAIERAPASSAISSMSKPVPIPGVPPVGGRTTGSAAGVLVELRGVAVAS